MRVTVPVEKVNSLYYILLCMYAFCLPTFNNLTPVILIALLVLTIFDYKSVRKFWVFERKKIATIALPLVFLMMGISLIYTSNFNEGTKLLFKSLPLLIAPLTLFKASELNTNQFNFIYKFYVYGCVLTILYSFSYVAFEYFEGSFRKVHAPENYIRYFLKRLTYHDLVSKNRVDHAIYFGAYILLAITIIKVKKELFSGTLRKAILLILFVTFLFLAPVIIAISGLIIFTLIFVTQNKDDKSSRNKLKLIKLNAFWAFIILYVFVWKIQPFKEYVYIFNNLKYNVLILSGMSITVILGQIFYQIYSLKLIKITILIFISLLGLTSLILIIYPLDLNTYRLSNYTARLVNNYSSIQILKDNFLFGVGIGDVQDNLVSVYKELGFRKIQFNEHNQYFRFWLGSGILTVLVFVVWIIKLLFKSIEKTNGIMMCITITFFLFCFTESVLARHMGITFFLFFIFLFNYSIDEETSKI